MLTRDQQERILCPIVISYRLVVWGGSPRPRSYEAEMRSFRNALRLDDPKLALIVNVARLTGRKLEWTSEVPALCT